MSARSTWSRLAYATFVLLLVAASSGCQLFPDRPEWPKKLFGKEEEAVVPTRMMVMWADTILHQPQQPGVRGFGARIYFYSEDGSDPVKVDGGLAVYAFDADDLTPKSAKPKRKYVFTADQFQEHMSHTSMGTSYSIWCPWDEVGGYNEQLSLIVRFEGRSGGVVISDSTVKLLPGLNKPAGVAATSKQDGRTIVQATASGDSESSTRLAGFEKVTKGSVTSKQPRRQTETIDLPPSFYRHLKGPTEPTGIPDASPESAPPTLDLAAAPSDSSGVALAEPKHDPIASESSTPRTSTPRTSTPRTSTPRTSTPRRASYPQRTLGDQELDAASEGTGQHSIPSGWIPSLPKTPRYGFPNASSPGGTKP